MAFSDYPARIRAIRHSLLLAALIILTLGASGDGYAAEYGTPISNREITPITNIFDDTAAYQGTKVTIQGVIDMQDQNGHWFYVQDEEARLYVEINYAAFSIPDLTRQEVVVEGVIEVNFDIPSLMATGVEPRQ